MERIAPLVDQLQRFCRGHLDGDRGAAANAVLACLREGWSDVAHVRRPSESADARPIEDLALCVVRDVGEMADTMIDVPDAGERLAWSRANLIFDLERYVSAVEVQARRL